MKLLKLFSSLLISLMYVFSNANAADYTIKLAHNGPEQHPFQDGALAFKSELEKSSNGAIEVQIFPGEQLGDEESTSQMIKLGTLQCAIESAGGGLAPFVPEADLLNLPFVFDDVDHFYRVVDGPIGSELAEKVETALNAEFMGWYFSGIRNVWNDERAVKSPDDLKGLKIRVMGSPVLIDTFNALGAQATPMSFGEVYTSIQQGVIDGAETDHVDLLVENFYEVTEHVSLTGHMYLGAGLICSNKFLDTLPADLKEKVIAAAESSVSVERAAMASMTGDALKQLKEKGLKFYDVALGPFREKVESVYLKNADNVGGMAAIEALAKQ